MKTKLVLTEEAHRLLFQHLYPGDRLEAVAVCLCGRAQDSQVQKLLVYKVHPVPYEHCVRRIDYIKWSTQIMEPLLKEASEKGLAILKIHSHPGGYRKFSELDDASDLELFRSVYGWMDDLNPHASAVMLPDGEIFARTVSNDQRFAEIFEVQCVGDSIKVWSKSRNRQFDPAEIRNIQAFGEGTIGILKTLKVGVVGCSGTGSPVIEQLVRLGLKTIVLVDPDKIEEANINRIVNSTRASALYGAFKVDALKLAIEKIGMGTEVITHATNLYDEIGAIRDLTMCDLIFGCVDSIDGRHLLNHISTFYLVPYIDLGVKLVADGKGSVDQICGTVHYIKPGGSSLMTRGLYNHEDLRAASLYRQNPTEYNNLKKSGYITNVNVNRPAVISVNMLVASIAVNEFMARIHNYRTEPNNQFAITRFSLTDSYFQFEEESVPDKYLHKFSGRGDLKPYLNMPQLAQMKLDDK